MILVGTGGVTKKDGKLLQTWVLLGDATWIHGEGWNSIIISQIQSSNALIYLLCGPLCQRYHVIPSVGMHNERKCKVTINSFYPTRGWHNSHKSPRLHGVRMIKGPSAHEAIDSWHDRHNPFLHGTATYRENPLFNSLVWGLLLLAPCTAIRSQGWNGYKHSLRVYNVVFRALH